MSDGGARTAPQERGPHPVGVRSFVAHDADRERSLPLELWYPAHADHRGEDLDDSTRDRFRIPVPGSGRIRQHAVRDARPAELPPAPLVIFSHGNAGHRRQSTFLTTHLASHGFVVVAPDHTGNTLEALASLPPLEQGAAVAASGRQRPTDLRVVLDQALDPAAELGAFTAARVDPGRMGASGHSFGGWTALKAVARDSRLRCALPLAPPGIHEGRGDPLAIGDTYGDEIDPGREVPTLVLAADRDSVCRLDAIEELVRRIPSSCWLAVLSPADHFHFGDFAKLSHRLFGELLAKGATGRRIRHMAPFDELMDERTGEELVRGAATAFFRWQLADDARAARWLLEELPATRHPHLSLRPAGARAA